MSLRRQIKWRRLMASLMMMATTLMVAAPALAVDEAMIKRMEARIQQQQRQIEAQAQAIANLQKQVGTMKAEVMAAAKKEIATIADPTPSPAMVSNKNDKVRLQLYGQVNRAVMVADDGENSDYYFVDNDATSSRIGFLGDARVNDDITVGARMEFEYQSNPSNTVNQKNKNPDGASFDDRWVDAQITSKRFGKIYLGKGSTASDDTAEVDLSGTALVGYSSVEDMAGGIRFYDDNSETLSSTVVADAFENFDGLGRQNRIRYDTPNFKGLTLSLGALSDGGDVALKYAAAWGDDFKFAAAASYANPTATSDTIDNQYSGSASILHRSGLNFSVAGGYGDLESGLTNPDGSKRDDDPIFYYAKLGFRTKLFEAGETRFSVDYARNEDVDQDDDDATSAGVQIVQDMPNWGSEYYLGYRWHELDRGAGNVDFEDVQSIMSGVRVKF